MKTTKHCPHLVDFILAERENWRKSKLASDAEELTKFMYVYRQSKNPAILQYAVASMARKAQDMYERLNLLADDYSLPKYNRNAIVGWYRAAMTRELKKLKKKLENDVVIDI